MSQGRTLVLSVDRDDDIGYKAGVESPVVGRDACINAATTLALADPEDSDLNAIFMAVRIYDELIAKGEEAEVAVISGNHMHMIEGDRKIAKTLDQVITDTGTSNCILISDGAEDEFVIPIIQSRIPVTSIRRVIVSQMPNLEGTYYILKKLLDDPKIARIVLVPIGLAMLFYAGASILGFQPFATMIVVGVIGSYLLYKGFGLDEPIRNMMDAFRLSLSRGRISVATYGSSILLAIIGVVMGMITILQYYSDASFGGFQYLMAFIYGAVGWLMGAGIVASVGIIMDIYSNEREGLGKVIVFPFFISAIGLIAYGASVYILAITHLSNYPIGPEGALKYIAYSTIVGLGLAFLGVAIQHYTNKWVAEHVQPAIIEVI